MITATSEQINIDLRSHQEAIGDWDKRALAEDLHTWAERFASEFKLKTGVPALMLDHLRRTCYGHFRPGRNGFGLANEIAINDRRIRAEQYWDTLVTLLHELLHAEQESLGSQGKGNYHNTEFRTKAKSFGLTVNQWGHTFVDPAPSVFWDVLQKYGIAAPEIPQAALARAASMGSSKLKLWVCSCQPKPIRIRVAIADLQARCLKCGQMFVRGTREQGPERCLVASQGQSAHGSCWARENGRTDWHEESSSTQAESDRGSAQGSGGQQPLNPARVRSRR